MHPCLEDVSKTSPHRTTTEITIARCLAVLLAALESLAHASIRAWLNVSALVLPPDYVRLASVACVCLGFVEEGSCCGASPDRSINHAVVIGRKKGQTSHNRSRVERCG
jgi:hypothetical protein